jgi:hypothetical protein
MENLIRAVGARVARSFKQWVDDGTWSAKIPEIKQVPSSASEEICMRARKDEKH